MAEICVFIMLAGILVVGAVWAWLIEPNTDIHAPTKEILSLLVSGERFIVRPPMKEELSEDRFKDFILVDKKTKQKTDFWFCPFDDNYHLHGDLDWMTNNEANKVGRVCEKIINANKEVERQIQKFDKLIRDNQRREEAKNKYN